MFIDEIIKSVSTALDAGSDLSAGADLLELEALAKPIPATNAEGKRLTDDFSEHDPDWSALEKRCVELLRRSLDLRVAVFYTASLLRQHSFAGFAQGMQIIKEMLSAKTYSAHPQPTATDTIVERWFTIAGLSAPYKRDGDQLRIIEGLRNILLVKKGLMVFSYREVLAARNKSGGADVAAIERMRAEWRNLPAEDRTEVSQSLNSALVTTREIEKLLVEQTPESLAPSGGGHPLQLLQQELRGLTEFIGEDVPQKKVEKADKKSEAKIIMQDGINSRADALRALHAVAEFFRRTEPASPVPYFVERAARLIDRDFLSLLGELAPDAVPVFQNLAGTNK